MLIAEPIETARLILRPETTEISAAIHTMNCDAEVMRFIANGKAWTSPVEEFLEQHRQAIARNQDKDWGGLSAHLKRSGEFIGLCWLAPNGYLGETLELGYRYIRTTWGHGYATEAASAVVEIGFNHLMLPKIGSLVHPQNLASIRVLEKLGFQHVKDVFHEAVNTTIPVYELPCPMRFV